MLLPKFSALSQVFLLPVPISMEENRRPGININENNKGKVAWEYWKNMERMLGNANIKE